MSRFLLTIWVAHGFYATSATEEFQYKCTDYYAPECELCLRWDDEMLQIEWLIIQTEERTISEKDRNGRAFNRAELYP